MIGCLPRKLEIGGKEYAIRSDYRDCLTIIEVFTDDELSDQEKAYCALVIMYPDYDSIPEACQQEAYEKMIWFLDGGDTVDAPNTEHKPVMDWKQDEALYFPAINKVAGMEVRLAEYIHFWTFLGYYNEIGDGLFATVVGIRSKKNTGKKLEKYEQEFYREHKNLIDLKKKETPEEKRTMQVVNRLLGN